MMKALTIIGCAVIAAIIMFALALVAAFIVLFVKDKVKSNE